MTKSWAITEDVSRWVVILAATLLAGAILLLVHELRSRRQRSWAIFATGLLAALCVSLAAVRPVWVQARGNLVGPRVVVLVDQSRRMRLSDAGTPRLQKATDALGSIARHFGNARLSAVGFSEGTLEPISLERQPLEIAARGARSDLSQALHELSATPGERPRAVIVVSDGRLSRPLAELDDARLREAVGVLGVPVHTVAVTDAAPSDASIRSIRAAGVEIGRASCRERVFITV